MEDCEIVSEQIRSVGISASGSTSVVLIGKNQSFRIFVEGIGLEASTSPRVKLINTILYSGQPFEIAFVESVIMENNAFRDTESLAVFGEPNSSNMFREVDSYDLRYNRFLQHNANYGLEIDDNSTINNVVYNNNFNYAIENGIKTIGDQGESYGLDVSGASFLCNYFEHMPAEDMYFEGRIAPFQGSEDISTGNAFSYFTEGNMYGVPEVVADYYYYGGDEHQIPELNDDSGINAIAVNFQNSDCVDLEFLLEDENDDDSSSSEDEEVDGDDEGEIDGDDEVVTEDEVDGEEDGNEGEAEEEDGDDESEIGPDNEVEFEDQFEEDEPSDVTTFPEVTDDTYVYTDIIEAICNVNLAQEPSFDIGIIDEQIGIYTTMCNELLDNGQTQELISTIHTCNYDNSALVISMVKSNSPYVSSEVIKALLDHSEIFTENEIVDIIIENSHVIKDDFILNSMNNQCLTNYSINRIRSSRHIKTPIDNHIRTLFYLNVIRTQVIRKALSSELSSDRIFDIDNVVYWTDKYTNSNKIYWKLVNLYNYKDTDEIVSYINNNNFSSQVKTFLFELKSLLDLGSKTQIAPEDISLIEKLNSSESEFVRNFANSIGSQFNLNLPALIDESRKVNKCNFRDIVESRSKENINATISISPNPAKDYVDVHFLNSSMDYAILSITGEIVEKGSLSIDDNRIIVEDLSAGYYLLVLDDKSTNYNSIEKLIIYD